MIEIIHPQAIKKLEVTPGPESDSDAKNLQERMVSGRENFWETFSIALLTKDLNK